MPDARKGIALSATSALLAATFFIPYKAATGYGPTDIIVIAMLGPAAVFNTLTTLSGGLRMLRPRRAELLAALLLGTLTVLGNVCMTEALFRIDAGVTSALLQTQVLFVALAGWFVLRERVTIRFGIGAVIALGGFAVMRLPTGEAVTSTTGMLFATGAATSFAMMHVVTRRLIARIRPVAVNALRLWLAVAILLLLPGRAEGLMYLDHRAWLLGLTAAFFGPYLARISIMYAVRYIAASHSTLITLITPVFAFVLEAIFLDSAPTAMELLGAAVILSGIALPIAELHRRPRG